MLKSNELLTMFAIIEKSDSKELTEITYCIIDEVVRRQEKEFYENPIFTYSEERIKNTESEKYE